MSDLTQPIVFSKKLQAKLIENNRILQALVRSHQFSGSKRKLSGSRREFAPIRGQYCGVSSRAIERGKKILFEGAQGTFLISTWYLSVCDFFEHNIGRRLHRNRCAASSDGPRGGRDEGIFHAGWRGSAADRRRAIDTNASQPGARVWCDNGRKRRCGWFDAVATRYAGMINGIDELAITNLDGLDHVDPIRVCVSYRLNGKPLDVPPCDASQLANCEPVYEEMRAGTRPLILRESFHSFLRRRGNTSNTSPN